MTRLERVGLFAIIVCSSLHSVCHDKVNISVDVIPISPSKVLQGREWSAPHTSSASTTLVVYAHLDHCALPADCNLALTACCMRNVAAGRRLNCYTATDLSGHSRWRERDTEGDVRRTARHSRRHWGLNAALVPGPHRQRRPNTEAVLGRRSGIHITAQIYCSHSSGRVCNLNVHLIATLLLVEMFISPNTREAL